MAATIMRNDVGDLFGDYQQQQRLQQQRNERQVHQLLMEGPTVGGRAVSLPMAPTRFRCRGPTTPLAGVRFVIEFSSILLLVFLCIVHEFSDVTMAKQLHIDSNPTSELKNQQAEIKTNYFDPPDGVVDTEDTEAKERKINTSNGGSRRDNENEQLISFSPESLDFGSRPIGLPVMRTVHVLNQNGRFHIQMISISGTTEHFHCSFFEEKMIGPRTNTTFQVVFLGRQEGLVNNTLYIHTSVGSFSYHVSAFGEASPYRLRPLIGARVPINGTFASLIHIYNPFSTPLQLTEMYSSGGGLFLDLPDELENIEEEELEDFSVKTITTTTTFSPSTSSTSSNRLQQRKEAELSDMPSRYVSGSCGDSQKNQRNPPRAAAIGGWENLNGGKRLKTLAWQVPPYETRPVVRAQFFGREAYNHTSYIRIHTNASDVQLMLPIEVEVSPTPDLYSSVDVIDFGTMRREYDLPIKRPILMVNAAEKIVDVQSITIKTNEASLGVVADFKLPLKVPQTPSKMPFNVGSLVLDPSNSTCDGVCMGKVIIKAENKNRYQLVIPFTMRMITGKLEYDPKQTQLFLSKAPGQVKNEPWELVVRNNFKQPMLIHSIKLIGHKGKECFRFVETETVVSSGEQNRQIKLPISLGVGEEKKLVKLLYTDPADGSHRFRTALRLKNNITNVDIPIYVYRGYLDVILPNSQPKKNAQSSSSSTARRELNLGHIGVRERKRAQFYLMNENSASVKLVVWQCDIDGVMVHFVGIEKTMSNKSAKIAPRPKEGSIDPSVNEDKKTKASPPTVIPPGHRAIFSIILQSNENRAKLLPIGSYSGKVLIRTQYEDIRLPISFKVLDGTLHASKVMLSRSFPGKEVTANIQINSTYKELLRIKAIYIEPSMAAITAEKVIVDNRFSIVNQTNINGALTIAPEAATSIQVAFNANKLCLGKLCYTALEVEREVGNLWLLSTSLATDNAYIDKELYILLRKKWSQLTNDDKNPMAKVRLQIEGYGPMVVNISARLYWPLLTNKMMLQFPSTRLGRMAKKEFMLENPGDITILVQLMSLEDYGHPDLFIQMMEAGMFQQRWTRTEIEAINATWQTRSAALGAAGTFSKPFFLYNSSSLMPGDKFSSEDADDLEQFSKTGGNIGWISSLIGGNTMTLLLPPGSRQRITVAFHPLVEGNVTSVLIMRNNLTILDVITLRGEGGRGFLRLGSVTNSGSSSSPIQRLNFDYNEKLLERLCNSGKTVNEPVDELDARKFLISRKFRATNIGRMGMTINRLLVDDQGCDSNGFLISHCKPIYLEPKQSVDFEIFYAPDFTQSEVRHQLSLVLDDDDENVQRYPMVVKIPKRLLTPCRERLPLLPWRNPLKFCLLFAAISVLVLSFFIGITDSKRVLGEIKTHEEIVLEDGNANNIDSVECTCSNQRGTLNGHAVKEISNGTANRKKSLETNGMMKSTNASNSQQQQQSKVRKRTKGGGNAPNNANNGQQPQQKDEKRAETNNASNGRQGRYKQAYRTASSTDLSLTMAKTIVDKSLPASVLKQYDQIEEINTCNGPDKKKETKEEKKIENGGHKQSKAANRSNKVGRGDSETRSNSTNSSTTGGTVGASATNGGLEASSSRSSSVSPSENNSAASSVKNVEKYTPSLETLIVKNPKEKMTEKVISNLEKFAWQLNSEKETISNSKSIQWKRERWETTDDDVLKLNNPIDSSLLPTPAGLAVGEERAGKARALTMPNGLTDFISGLDAVELLGSMSQSNILQATEAASCGIGGDQWPFSANPFRNSFDSNLGEVEKRSTAASMSEKNHLGWLNKNVANDINVQHNLSSNNQVGGMYHNFLNANSVSNSSIEALQQKHSSVKDIWDLPITNFDSINTKSVRNNNDYNDMERQHRFAFGSWEQTVSSAAAPTSTASAVAKTAVGAVAGNNSVKRKDQSQQAWKIDEWSNEIAKTSGISHGKSGACSKQVATTTATNNLSMPLNENTYYYNQHRNNENIYETFFKNRDQSRKPIGSNNNNQIKAKTNRLSTRTPEALNNGAGLLPLPQLPTPPPATSNSSASLALGSGNSFFSRAIERPTSSNSSSTMAAAKVKNISPPPGLEGLPRFENQTNNLSLDHLMMQQRMYERSNSMAHDHRANSTNSGGVSSLFDDMLSNQGTMNDMANFFAVSSELRNTPQMWSSSLNQNNGAGVNNPTGVNKSSVGQTLAGGSSLFDTDNVWTSNSPPDSNFWKSLDGNIDGSSNTASLAATSRATFAWPLSSTSGIAGSGSEPVSATSALSSAKWASFDSPNTSLFSGNNNPLLMNVMDHTSPWPSTSSLAKTLDSMDSNSFGLSVNSGLISNGQQSVTTGTNSSPLFNDIFGVVSSAVPTSSAGVIGSGVCRNASPLSTGSNASSVATNSVGSNTSNSTGGSSGIGGSSTGVGSNPSPNSHLGSNDQAGK